MKESRSKSPKQNVWKTQYSPWLSCFFFILDNLFPAFSVIKIIFFYQFWDFRSMQFYSLSSISGHFWHQNVTIIKPSQCVAKKVYLNSFIPYLRSLWCKNWRGPERSGFCKLKFTFLYQNPYVNHWKLSLLLFLYQSC